MDFHSRCYFDILISSDSSHVESHGKKLCNDYNELI